MYKRILVPVDGSETSNRALVTALQFARDFGGRVRLVHVVEDLTYVTGDDPSGYSGKLATVMREAGERILAGGLAIAQSAGVQADSMLFDNPGERLAETVADAARRWNADLIVAGTHGRRGLGRVLMGSGAEQIVRLAPVPVLVVRLPESSQPSPA
ncbi:MAG: universal stress protein [Polaromonas sp.]|uniref:universal stress protein n=1 Tax=Polaromonas sp. TaxID=1869339 RepID=UPI002735EDE6|nr:universal stress protein [Polaromonas sp.]MDP3797007.1 universal stress protein [Polaromonas sp.]